MFCTRRFEFDAGHRVLGHGGKCCRIHGHRYVADVQVWSEQLNSLGMVVDFGDIKSIVKEWIDEHWDHNFICHPADPLYNLIKAASPEAVQELTGGKAFYVMPDGINPTAENMAQHLLLTADALLRHLNVRVTSVRLYETPNGWSDYANPYYHPSS